MDDLFKDLPVVTDAEVAELKRRGFVWECTAVKRHMKTANNIFNAGCCYHDAAYAFGGSERDRMIADRGFYRRCLANATQIRSVRKIWWYFMIATSWYLAVRIFGWAFFTYNKTRPTLETVLVRNDLHHGKGFWHLPAVRRAKRYLRRLLK